MSKFRLLPFAMLLSVFASIGTATLAQPAKIVTFATDPQKKGGFVLELTVEAYKKVGYEVRVDFVPFNRAIEMAKSGQVDGVLGPYYSDERAKYFFYSDVIAESPVVFFALESSKITYSKLEDLSKYKIGTTVLTVYPKEFFEASFLRKEPALDYILNIRKLLAGRIDLFVEKKRVVTSFLLGSPPTKRIVALDPPLEIAKFYNSFAKTAPNAAEKLHDFNMGLKMIKDDGLYAIIMNKNLHE
jgi:polar amino acid transport system substrate-binding protein